MNNTEEFVELHLGCVVRATSVTDENVDARKRKAQKLYSLPNSPTCLEKRALSTSQKGSMLVSSMCFFI